jgi:hypothetical protein
VIMRVCDCAGNQCDTHYPGVPPSAYGMFWSEVESIFEGLLFDNRKSMTNETTIGELVSTNQRVVIYTSPGNFSGGSPHALDGCLIDNVLTDSVNTVQNMTGENAEVFASAITQRAEDKSINNLFLLSMSSGWPQDQLIASLVIDAFPFLTETLTQWCLSIVTVANLTSCPLHLMDSGLLGNYYNQIVFDLSLTPGYDLPGAIYIDAVDVNGTIRTGPQRFGQFYPDTPGNNSLINGEARYAYVDTLLLGTVRRLCGLLEVDVRGGPGSVLSGNPLCDAYVSVLQHQRSEYPTMKWDDPSTGRNADWPSSVPLGSGTT